jgi:hypothetical protein
MKPRAFFDKVSEMREAQKEYFKTRSSAALNRSKALEKEIDDEIARVNAILNKRPQVVQGNLFGEGQE